MREVSTIQAVISVANSLRPYDLPGISLVDKRKISDCDLYESFCPKAETDLSEAQHCCMFKLCIVS